jgi:uncharacterized membrane-anchored protein YjiN (DUF445 family)
MPPVSCKSAALLLAFVFSTLSAACSSQLIAAQDSKARAPRVRSTLPRIAVLPSAACYTFDVKKWRQSGLVELIENHKGNLALCLSLALYLVSWPVAWLDRAAAQIIRAAGEASLVGGICDLIALRMIFEQHWYLPNSGVLQRNKQKFIDGLADQIEKKWLTPEMIGTKLHELRPLDRLAEHLGSASLKTLVREDQLERICTETARYLEPETVIRFLENLTSRVKPARALDRLKLAIVRAIARRECEHLRQKIRELPHDEHLIALVDSAIHDAGNALLDGDTVLRKTAEHWLDAIVGEVVLRSRGEIARMVRENLGRLRDEEIREQIESRTRAHLDWIRVNGGVFGAILGCLFALLNAARYDLQAVWRLMF